MSAKKADTWMPLYVADYLRDTMHLSTEQHGAYMLLLMSCWTRGGSLPNDSAQLAGIVRMAPAAWRKVAPILLGFFCVEASRITHKRVSIEWEKAQRLSEVRSEAASKGNVSRWGAAEVAGSRSERLAAARAKASHTKAEWRALVEATGNRCVACLTPEGDLHGGALCKDHIIAVYKGGNDGIDNLQPMCRNCNTSKGGGGEDLREIASPGWRKRLAERLAERLANASQTSPPSPSPTPDGVLEDANASLSPSGDVGRKYPDVFEACWKAYPHVKGRSSKTKAFGYWRRLPAETRTKLLPAIERYSREGREPKAECGAPAMERWLRDSRFGDWLDAPQTSTLTAHTFPGPAEIRAAIVSAMGEDFAKSWLDRCEWDDGQEAVICGNGFVVDRLRRDVGPTLSAMNTRILQRQRGA